MTESAADVVDFYVGGSKLLSLASSGTGLTIIDGGAMVLGSTNGFKIGTATTQKLGFYNAAPIVQPAKLNDPADAAGVLAWAANINALLKNLGLMAN